MSVILETLQQQHSRPPERATPVSETRRPVRPVRLSVPQARSILERLGVSRRVQPVEAFGVLPAVVASRTRAGYRAENADGALPTLRGFTINEVPVSIPRPIGTTVCAILVSSTCQTSAQALGEFMHSGYVGTNLGTAAATGCIGSLALAIPVAIATRLACGPRPTCPPNPEILCQRSNTVSVMNSIECLSGVGVGALGSLVTQQISVTEAAYNGGLGTALLFTPCIALDIADTCYDGAVREGLIRALNMLCTNNRTQVQPVLEREAVNVETNSPIYAVVDIIESNERTDAFLTSNDLPSSSIISASERQ